LADANPYQFSSKERDTFTGFYYYGYRFYDPATGRWLSRDPINELGGSNLYAYCVNRPVDKVDYLGLDVFLYFWDSSQGASGSGHVGIGAGTTDQQEYFEANPQPSGIDEPMRVPYQQSGSQNDVVKKSADYEDYGQSPKLILRIKSTPDQDKKVVEALKKWFKDHPHWILFTSDCADAAKTGLVSINIPTGRQPIYATQQELSRYIYKQYHSQPDKVSVVSGDWNEYNKDNGTKGFAGKTAESAWNATKSAGESAWSATTGYIHSLTK